MKRILILACLGLAAPLAAAQEMDHSKHMMMSGKAPVEPGQSAFAAIQEIVGILENDPHTDWSKVDIEALRQHLIDMNNVTLGARAAVSEADGVVTFDVSGDGPVRDSVRRMVLAHAATMNGVDGWTFEASEMETGARLAVTPPDQASLAKLRALGFIGVMARGMHHQTHHLMIALGITPHH